MGQRGRMNITDPIRQVSRARPDAIAMLRASGEPLSYRALDRTIDRCAHRARVLGLQPGQTVAIALSRYDRPLDETLGMIVALGLARAGVITSDTSLATSNAAATMRPLPDLKAIVVGGSQLPRTLWQQAVQRLCPNVLTTFGATETSMVAMAPNVVKTRCRFRWAGSCRAWWCTRWTPVTRRCHPAPRASSACARPPISPPMSMTRRPRAPPFATVDSTPATSAPSRRRDC